MARGKKTDNETIYKIMISMFNTNNFSETARQLNVPITTVEKIYKQNKDKEEFVKLCNEKKEEFADKATRIIDKATTLLEQKIDIALEQQEKLNKILDDVMDLTDKDANYQRKKALANKIEALQLNRLSELTTAVGTLYDKRALAQGESTVNNAIKITMSEDAKELAE